MKFTQLSKIKTSSPEWLGLSAEHQRICELLERADHKYMDDGIEGNYLEDFLHFYGPEKASPIKMKGGCAAGRGDGICFAGSKLERLIINQPDGGMAGHNIAATHTDIRAWAAECPGTDKEKYQYVLDKAHSEKAWVIHLVKE